MWDSCRWLDDNETGENWTNEYEYVILSWVWVGGDRRAAQSEKGWADGVRLNEDPEDSIEMK